MRGFLLPAARVSGCVMNTAIEYGNPDLWLVLLMLAAGVISSALLSTDPVNVKRLVGDVLRGFLVAIILWAYGVIGEISILKIITLAGLASVAWPHTVNEVTRFAKRTISRMFGGRKQR